MTGLLDVNVLIALLWPFHEAHDKVQKWFGHNARHGWATCALTEAGFVRIVSNPVFSARAVSPHDALLVLRGSLEHPEHTFWKDDIAVPDALIQFGRRLVGHQQVTDAYLLALAIHKKGRLVTLDSTVSSLLPDDSPARGGLLLI